MPDNPQPSKESVEAAKRFVSSHGTCLTGYSTFEGEADFELAVAAFYDEAYRRGRESMREEAARLGEAAASTLMLRETPRYEGDDGPATLRTVRGIGQAIRSLPLTEVKKDD